MITSLSLNSGDGSFLGYPYCLAQADQHARVSKKEQEYLRTLLLSQVKNKEKLNALLSSINTHDVLDSLQY